MEIHSYRWLQVRFKMIYEVLLNSLRGHLLQKRVPLCPKGLLKPKGYSVRSRTLFYSTEMIFDLYIAKLECTI